MTIVIQLALLSWPGITLVAFLLFHPRIAVLISYIGGVLFLPNTGFPIQGFVDFDKSAAMAFSCLLGIAAFDLQRLVNFRPHVFDIPMLLFCLMPMVTILQLGLGAKLGLTVVITETLKWGVPYLVGRLYFADHEGRRDLALGLLVGVLLYVPLCLYEIRLSPQLNRMVYGFSNAAFGQSARGGGFRPTVFMQHGLMVGLWMAVGAATGFFFWLSRGVKTVFGFPMAPVLLVLVATSVLCKSTGATMLLMLGILALMEGRWLGTRYLIWFLLIGPSLFVAARIFGLWTGETLIQLAGALSPERAESLEFRMKMENYLFDAMGSQSVLGRGPLSFGRVINDYGQQVSAVTDSLWMIQYARFGGLGLIFIGATFVLPLVKVFPKIPPRLYADRRFVCTSVLALSLTLFMVDCVLNTMINQAYILVMGGLTGYAAAPGSRPV